MDPIVELLPELVPELLPEDLPEMPVDERVAPELLDPDKPADVDLPAALERYVVVLLPEELRVTPTYIPS